MKHLKALNKKAALLEQAAAEGKAEEVQLMQTVAGCSSIRVDAEKRQFTIGDVTIKEGDYISLNGGLGEVIHGQVPVEDAKLTGDFGTFMGWADEYRTMGVRANADSPEDVKKAVESLKARGADDVL